MGCAAWVLVLATAPLAAEVGSQACAPCHAAIYKSYVATAMARSSGALDAASIREKSRTSAIQTPSGSRYRIVHAGDRIRYSGVGPEGSVERTLQYFVGSGAVGRSYLYSIDQYLFQAPVSWYALAGKWEISPGFEKLGGELRPVEPGCLRCHASRIQPVRGTANRYASPPFLEGGISCERCHGPGEAHVAGGKIVNPAKLDPGHRDSVCAQCHLSGATEISKGGTYQPGQLLSDSSVTFVWKGRPQAMPVISHFERMAQSRCRQADPAKFWCGTCHNPHSEPTRDGKAAYYREKCATCHTADACQGPKPARAAKADDCTACHMPKSEAAGVRHAAFTDHSIPRRPGNAASAVPGPEDLVPFGDAAGAPREVALAWADVALKEDNRNLGMRAFQLLQKLYTQDPADARVTSQLAQFLDRMGRQREACAIYEAIVTANPETIAPAVNLGSCYAGSGRLRDAITLWRGVLARSPGMEGARLNLAVAQFRSGEAGAARATLSEGLRFDPLSNAIRQMLKTMAKPAD